MYMYGKHRLHVNIDWRAWWVERYIAKYHWETLIEKLETIANGISTYEFYWKLCMNKTDNEVEIDNDDEPWPMIHDAFVLLLKVIRPYLHKDGMISWQWNDNNTCIWHVCMEW